MQPARVRRDHLHTLTDLPNVGPSIAQDLRRIGITHPEQLHDCSAIDLYRQLCAHDGVRHDPCVLDTFISIEQFMRGHAPRPWWDYTSERKQLYADL